MNDQAAFDRAIQMHQSGNLAEAEAIYRRILEENPHHADALNLLGVLESQRGRNHQAVDLISRAIALNGTFPDYHINLSQACRLLGDLNRSIAAARRASELDSNLPEAFANLGLALVESGKAAEAIAAYRRVVELKPGDAEAFRALGSALRKNGQLDMATETLRRAVELKPDFAAAYLELGNLASDQRRPEEAVARHRRAIECNPRLPEAYNNLGKSLAQLSRLHEAIAACERAIELKPDFLVALMNLAIFYVEGGEFRKAIAALQRVIELNPRSARAHLSLAECLLLLGDFRKGLPDYEWRDEPPNLSNTLNAVRPPPLRWDGGDADGRTLFVHCEQGFGDCIQFVRYIPMLMERGASVILGCPTELARLFRSSFTLKGIIAIGESIPNFDSYCLLASLPLLFGTTLESIPANVRYLKADPILVDVWARRIGRGDRNLRVGLAWAGRPDFNDDVRRSLHFGQLSPLAVVSNVDFYSLQKGAPASQLASPPPGMNITDIGREISDFADTAAAMSCLDLIISTDTSVAHLAGALGIPVWLMVHFPPTWRWLLDREDSPWYPTMRLFRQVKPGDWGEVINRVANELARAASDHCRTQKR